MASRSFSINLSKQTVGVLVRNAIIACLSGILAACAPYSFSGGRTALVKTISIPMFGNETAEFGLAEALTEGIINGFVEDNQIKVVDQSAAEAVLNGKVTDYSRKAYTFDETDQVKEYIVEIWVAASLDRKNDSGAVWTQPNLRGFGVYPADSAEVLGQTRAIDKLTEDIINLTVRSW